jgi:hypothetical protein
MKNEKDKKKINRLHNHSDKTYFTSILLKMKFPFLEKFQNKHELFFCKTIVKNV